MNTPDLKTVHKNCTSAQNKADEKCLGQWNGYVEKGSTKIKRRERLAEVPKHLQKSVQNHVETVFRLKVKQRNNK